MGVKASIVAGAAGFFFLHPSVGSEPTRGLNQIDIFGGGAAYAAGERLERTDVAIGEGHDGRGQDGYGQDGVSGKNGQDGEDGKDGKSGRDGEDGKAGKPGKGGKAGKPGKDGKAGKPGKAGGGDGKPGKGKPGKGKGGKTCKGDCDIPAGVEERLKRKLESLDSILDGAFR